MRIGDVLRYGRPKNPTPQTVDGMPNFWHLTSTPGATLAQLESGIDKIGTVKSPCGPRVPAILIGSSPHKAGSVVTPWQDTIDPDIGYALYYGDSKAIHDYAPATHGNLEMLDAYKRHSSPDKSDRLKAEPLVVFERVHKKGYVRFAGFGIIDRVRLVTQIDMKSRRPFANYAFELILFDLAAEGEEFCWDWISARRSKDKTNEQCLAIAPKSWRVWVDEGKASHPRIRRSVAKASIVSTAEQQPAPGTPEAEVLEEIVSFYEGKKHRFEAVAELIADSVIGGGTSNYHLGWISRRGHDFGIDFVGRLDIGDGFARTSLIVLGQAKCERSVTSARDIARTVARLQRGWFGCYVTTSFFSSPVQQEVIEDKYPLALVHGLRVAQEFQKMTLERGLTTLDLLKEIDAAYEDRLAERRPEEVLLV
ncbi:restriction endonuclease [Mycobacterium colombiense]|uniref:restriction endonuclease n=1 Tax=Mycobacterium colombiense TaxID=339268 RepID=UPI0007FF2BD7|nr:restriction endonuclease [Mycobacterium colombiense]OBJ65818.1 hypothetical protein A5627_05735 [Mycobacterium colombiense]